MVAESLIILLMSCKEDSKNESKEAEEGEVFHPSSNVLLLIMDGVRNLEFTTSKAVSGLTGTTGEGWAPHTWETLGTQGTVVRSIYNVGIPITAPSHASFFAGRSLSYGHLPNDPNLHSLYRPELPTLFEEAERQLKLEDGQVMFMADGSLLQDVSASLYPGFTDKKEDFQLIMGKDSSDASNDDDDVFEAIKEYIGDHHPRLLAANIHHVDTSAHFDPDENAYENNVAKIDRGIGDLYRWLQEEEPDYLSKTMIVLTADHGRHQTEGWRGHGDSCQGCRELPLFLVGSGIPKEEVKGAVINQWDVSMMIATRLGIQFPYGEGLPQLGFDFSPRTGDVSVVASENHVAVEHYQNDPHHRSSIFFDGEEVSDHDAFAAEAPRIAVDSERSYVCWRELKIEPEETPDTGYWPWLQRCVSRKNGEKQWKNISFPDHEVGPVSSPSLLLNQGKLEVGWPVNLNVLTGMDSSVATATYDINLDTWTKNSDVPGFFPTETSMILVNGIPMVAAGENNGDSATRFNRQIAVIQGERVTFLDPREVLGSGTQRVERPAIFGKGDTIRVAALGFSESGTHLLQWESSDAGAHWSAATEIVSPFLPFAHITPAWDGEQLVWAGVGPDGMAGFCRHSTSTVCISAGSPRIDSFAVTKEGVLASVDVGVGNWEMTSFSW